MKSILFRFPLAYVLLYLRYLFAFLLHLRYLFLSLFSRPIHSFAFFNLLYRRVPHQRSGGGLCTRHGGGVEDGDPRHPILPGWYPGWEESLHLSSLSSAASTKCSFCINRFFFFFFVVYLYRWYYYYRLFKVSSFLFYFLILFML